jgi:acetyl-CoA carboxylase biotin carboxyl carrier protein
MPEKFVVDGESVRGLANLLEETGLTEIEYQVGVHRIRVVRGGVAATIPHYTPPPAPVSVSTPASPSVPEVKAPAAGESVLSPMVGTVYLSGEPEAPPFIKAGDLVSKGETLLIVEAMKVMNPIRAPRDGKVLEVCVKDSKPVEFGEPLVILE